ncbi:MAG: anthranilate synthase component II [Lachnospiraceae bacterium]
MILLVDNYDSFSYNLYQCIGTINPDIKVIRNDEKTVEEIKEMAPERIIISPGPGKPSEAGNCKEIIAEFAGTIPIFGVCLGHQAICETFGATVTYAKTLMHGKQSDVKIDNNCRIFKNMQPVIKAARYHSLAAAEETIPEVLQVIATADDGTVMAVKHRDFEIYGVQFHPESILTPDGMQILKNFLIDR